MNLKYFSRSIRGSNLFDREIFFSDLATSQKTTTKKLIRLRVLLDLSSIDRKTAQKRTIKRCKSKRNLNNRTVVLVIFFFKRTKISNEFLIDEQIYTAYV